MSFLKSIIARVGMDGSEFELGAKRVESTAEKMGENIAHHFKSGLAAAFGVAAIEEATRHIIEYGAQIQDLSVRLGISTEAAQIWDRALKENRASLETGVSFFEKLASARRKVMEGGAGGAKLESSFKELGVSIDDLKNKRIEDIAAQIGDLFAAGGDPQQLIGALKEVGGKGAGDMVGTLISDVRKLGEEFKKMGLIIDDGVVKQLKEAEERGKQFAAQLEAALAPVVAGIIKGFQYFFNMLKTDVSYIAGVLYHLSQHPLEFGKANKAGIEQAKEMYDQIKEEEKALDDKLNKPKPTGGALPEDKTSEIAEITRLYERLNAVQEAGRTAGLSKEQKILELKKEQAELTKKMEDGLMGRSGPYSQADNLKNLIHSEEIRNKLKELEKPETKTHHREAHADSLQRIGISVGGAAENILTNLAREQLAVSRQIAHNTAHRPAHAQPSRHSFIHQ